MPSQFSVVIIDPDRLSRDSILTTLRPYSDTITLAGSVDNFSDGAAEIQKNSPNVVFLGVDDLQKGVKDVQFITLLYPRVSVIACSSEQSSEWILALMRAGAVEYLLRPIGQEELKLSLQKVGRFLFPAPPRGGKLRESHRPLQSDRRHGDHHPRGEPGGGPRHGGDQGRAGRPQP